MSKSEKMSDAFCANCAGDRQIENTISGQVSEAALNCANCAVPASAEQGASGLKGFWQILRSNRDFKVTLPGAMLLALTFFLPGGGVASQWVTLIQLLLLPLAGWTVMRGAWRSLTRSHSLDMTGLMTIASVGAVLIGETAEALVLLLLFSVSEALEDYANARARSVLSGFSDLAPKFARRLTGGREEDIPVEALRVGDVIVIRPGERLPMDGTVLEGQSEIDQSVITGESQPVPVQAGSGVLSGSINGQGALRVRVERLAADTTIQRIINLVTEAQANHSDQQKFIDRFSKVYTPIVFAIAVAVALVPVLFFGQPLLNQVEGYGWLHRALSVLLVGCPCALVISTPVTMISGLTRAARLGVVFKGGIYLEQLGQTKAIAFDKTGTLTKGIPTVSLVQSIDCEGAERCEPCGDMLALAGSLEQHSSHPLGQAVVAEADAWGVLTKYPAAEGVVNLPGRGQQGYINGQLSTVGSLNLFLAEHNTPPSLAEQARSAQAQGQTTMLVCDGERVRGLIGVEDEIRPEAAAVIRDLSALGIHSVMLTGDTPSVAGRVADEIGLPQVRAGLLPEQKLEELRRLRTEFGPTAMVGDGINDAPALANADVGIAMGGALTAQVLETADVVLMDDNLRRLPDAIRLSRRTNQLIRQNIAISLGLKAIAAVLAVSGLTPLWVAVLADMGISLAVTLNGMRVGKFQPEALRAA